MPFLLPVAESSDHFENLILDDHWVSINLIGLIATLLLTLGFPGFYMKVHAKLNSLGFYGLMITSIGLILFTSIQYYETLIWPAAAQVNPELLQVSGALVSGDSGVMTGLILSGIFLGLGYILFGISLLHSHTYPKIPVWLLIVGAPVFGNGLVFPIRTIGLLLLCVGTIWLSLNLVKFENKNSQ